MSQAQQETVQANVAADGTGTFYTSKPYTGQVVNVVYTPDGSTAYDNTVDFTITAETSGVNIWKENNINAAKTVSPVQVGNINTTGAASTITENPVFVANERIKIVLAQGGVSKKGSFTVVVA